MRFNTHRVYCMYFFCIPAFCAHAHAFNMYLILQIIYACKKRMHACRKKMYAWKIRMYEIG